MPIMDGLEATKLIRATEQSNGRHLPIIAMTAQADERTWQCCLNAGMDGYLTKPVQAETLIHTRRGNRLTRPIPAVAGRTSLEFSLRLKSTLMPRSNRVNGDRKFFGEMAGIFLKESPHLMSRIRDGIAGGDLRRAGSGGSYTEELGQRLHRTGSLSGSRTHRTTARLPAQSTAPSIRTNLLNSSSISSPTSSIGFHGAAVT